MGVDKIINRLDSISLLEKGWGGHEYSMPITSDLIERVKSILQGIDSTYLNGWNVFPCVNGSLLFDFTHKTIDANINFSKNGYSAFVRTPDSTKLVDNSPYDESIKEYFKFVYTIKNEC